MSDSSDALQAQLDNLLGLVNALKGSNDYLTEIANDHLQELRASRKMAKLMTEFMWLSVPDSRERSIYHLERLLGDGSITHPETLDLLAVYLKAAKGESQKRPEDRRSHLTLVRDPPKDD